MHFKMENLSGQVIVTPDPKSAARGGPADTSIIDPQRPRTPHPDFELDGPQTQLARWDNEGGAGRRPIWLQLDSTHPLP